MNLADLTKSYSELKPEISYKIYKIKKPNGKFRKITAPNDNLKSFQKEIMLYLSQFSIHNLAHGFVSGRSIATNALPHIKKNFVLNIDLKNFFPSVKRHMIIPLFQKLNIEKFVDYVLYEDGLAQGSPCSPVITNLYCYDLDKNLEKLSKEFGYSYTRYADDLTFSGNKLCKGFIKKVYIIVKDYGLIINKEKTKIQKRNVRQTVTGVVVNEKLNICRKTKKKIRAMKHQYESLTEYEKQYLCGMNGLEVVLKRGFK